MSDRIATAAYAAGWVASTLLFLALLFTLPESMPLGMHPVWWGVCCGAMVAAPILVGRYVLLWQRGHYGSEPEATRRWRAWVFKGRKNG